MIVNDSVPVLIAVLFYLSCLVSQAQEFFNLESWVQFMMISLSLHWWTWKLQSDLKWNLLTAKYNVTDLNQDLKQTEIFFLNKKYFFCIFKINLFEKEWNGNWKKSIKQSIQKTYCVFHYCQNIRQRHRHPHIRLPGGVQERDPACLPAQRHGRGHGEEVREWRSLHHGLGGRQVQRWHYTVYTHAFTMPFCYIGTIVRTDLQHPAAGADTGYRAVLLQREIQTVLKR